MAGEDIRSLGEVSKAHCGILLIDEFNELDRALLDLLRDPLQKGEIVHSRGGFTERFPCRFQLVATMNPCKCTRYGIYYCRRCREELDVGWCFICGASDYIDHKCKCRLADIRRYRSRISGAIEERIDLKVKVSPTHSEALRAQRKSRTAKRYVNRAIKRQQVRYGDVDILRNGDLPSIPLARIKRVLGSDGPKKSVERVLPDLKHELSASTRTIAKILAVSRTIADMQEDKGIDLEHVESAIEHMGLRDEYWRGSLERGDSGGTADEQERAGISKTVISQLRRLNLTPEQLAEKAHVSSKVVRDGLSGKYDHVTPALARLFDYLKVSRSRARSK